MIFNWGMKKWKLRKYYPAGMYFVTMNTYQREPVLTEPDVLAAFRCALKRARDKYPLEVHAWVVMPDHMHFVIRTHHIELGRFIACFKSHMTRALPKYSSKKYNLNDKFKQRRRAKRGSLWHKGFYEHWIADQADYERCIKYCVYNPVKHGYANRPWEWPHSTLHEFIAKGREFGGAINVLGIKYVFSVGSVPSVVKSLVLNHVNRFARVATYMRHYGFNG